MAPEVANHPIRVLLIDDDPVDRRTVCRALGDGYAVVEADDGRQARERLNAGEFDCVLLDYTIPGTDPHRLLTEIGPRCAAVMLTGRDDATSAVETMKAGAQDYLIKSKMTPEGLRRAVLNAIERVALLRQIEDQRRELELLATTDGLTGLYNRRYFLERLDQEIARAVRFCIPLSLLMLDLDHFKRINDSHGHLVGDQALIHVAGILKSALRGTDLQCRYGGEEFCILTVGTGIGGAEALANRVCRLFAQTLFHPGTSDPLTVTCSVGVAELDNPCEDAQQLLNAADLALYAAKRGGRNRVVIANGQPQTAHGIGSPVA